MNPNLTNAESLQQTVTLTIEQALQQAIAHHRAGRLQEAEHLYRAILQDQPNHPDANHNLGVLALQARHPAVALPHFKTALEADPKQGQYWLSYIDALIQSGQSAAAWQVLEQGRKRGLQGEALEALAGRLEGYELIVAQPDAKYQNALKESLPALSASAQNSKKNPRAKPTKADKPARKPARHQEKSPSLQEIKTLAAMFAGGRYTEAAALAQVMTERFPLNGVVWKALGAAYKQKGLSEAALAAMQKAATLSPSDVEAHYNLGNTLYDLGQLDEAEASYQRVLEIKPDDADAHNNLGNTRKALGRLDEAEASYRRAIKIKPGSAEAHSNLGNVLKNMGRLDEAEASYRRALEIKPSFAEAHGNLGIILKDMGRFDEAEASYRWALEIKPDYVNAYVNLGAILQELEQLDKAEASYRRALEIKPNFAEAHSNLGNTLKELGRHDEAEASYRRALAIKPDMAEAYNNLGVILKDLGRLNEAEASYRQAIQNKPDYAEAHNNLGHILCDLDDLGQAAVAYQKTLDIDPANYGLDAAVYLGILYYLDEKLEQCRSMLLASQPIMAKDSFKYNNSRNYRELLDKLLSWHRQSNHKVNQAQGMATLYVIGESHSLAAHGVVVRYNRQEMRCAAEWIAGCKQWHLGNGKANKYKHKFEAVMARLPRDSAILLFIGEIDCRHDEGIINVCHKHPDRTLAEVMQSTVDAYVNYVAAIGACYGHRLIVGGVPCTNIPLDALTANAAEQLVHLIRIFNARLRSQALAAGMDFLDVYALSDRSDGIASGEWHIDKIHLLPSAIVEAFEKYCLPRTPSATNFYQGENHDY